MASHFARLNVKKIEIRKRFNVDSGEDNAIWFLNIIKLLEKGELDIDMTIRDFNSRSEFPVYVMLNELGYGEKQIEEWKEARKRKIEELKRNTLAKKS